MHENRVIAKVMYTNQNEINNELLDSYVFTNNVGGSPVHHLSKHKLSKLKSSILSIDPSLIVIQSNETFFELNNHLYDLTIQQHRTLISQPVEPNLSITELALKYKDYFKVRAFLDETFNTVYDYDRNMVTFVNKFGHEETVGVGGRDDMEKMLFNITQVVFVFAVLASILIPFL
ncbi:MAG: hypothetical protein PF447_06395, partial [Spirochaetaceae bacterium]|nr:hypothetical protein [Spirochaetaceae bacterium]